jgi:hypothetical protein
MPEGQKGLHTPHDSGFKYLLSSKKAFVQLLRSFVKAPWAEQVEEASLVRLDKSFLKTLRRKIPGASISACR